MRRLALNIATTYAARFSNIIAIFLLFAWVEQAVGSSAYGVYLLTASIAALLSMDLGLAGATTRYIALAAERDDHAEIRRITGASSLFFVGVGVVALSATLGIVALGWATFEIPSHLRQAAVYTTILAAAQAFAASAFSVNRHVLAGAGRLDIANVVQLGQIGVRVLLTVAILAVGEGIVVVAAVDLLVVLLGGSVSWYLRRRFCPTSKSSVLKLHRPTMRQLLGLSIDLLVLSIAGLVILQTGNLVVSLFLPIAAVTVFSAGFRIYQAARELTNSLTSALLPFASRQFAAGAHTQNADLYLTGTRLASLVVVGACVPLAVFAPLIVSAWLGPGFEGAAVVSQILVLSLIINTQHLVAVPILTAQGNIRPFAVLHGIWAIACIGLGLVLTPWLGIAGMAVAIAAPVVVLEPAYLWVLLRRLQVPFRRYAAAIGPLAAVSAVLGLGLVAVNELNEVDLVSACLVAGGWLICLLGLYWVIVASPGERRYVIRMSNRFVRRGSNS